jgi:hypothetical protein
MTTNCVPVWRERCANSNADCMGRFDVDLCGVGNCMGGCVWICWECVTLWVGVMWIYLQWVTMGGCDVDLLTVGNYGWV